MEFIDRRYKEPLPVVVPGGSLRNIWCDLRKPQADVPMQFRVAVTYLDDRRRPYSDGFNLGAEIYSSESAANPGGQDYAKRQALATEAAVWEVWRGRL